MNTPRPRTSTAGTPMTSYDDLPAALVDELTRAGLDPRAVHAAVLAALAEDLPDGAVDVTSVATVAAEARAEAVVRAREDGVVSGLGIAALVFATVARDVEFTDRVADGTTVAPGDVVLRVAGPTRGLLTAERTALNFASHLSGVATATARWVAAVQGTRARVLDTRKTLPGWRALEKYAVRCGGGVNHRFSLADMAMVKDNHVQAAAGVVPAWRAVRERFPDVPVEVEVDRLDQLEELLAVGCEHVLLDNMDIATMSAAVRLTDGRATLEASGGLTLDRAREVAQTGVDFISVGALTHSVRVFDLGLDMVSDPAAEQVRA